MSKSPSPEASTTSSTWSAGVHDVQRDAHVPVALGRAVPALDVGLELHDKAQVAQDLLELLLLAVTAIDRVGIGLDDLPLLADISPQRGVVEMATVGLAHGVVEVLDIGEHCNFFHRVSSWMHTHADHLGRKVAQYASPKDCSANNRPEAPMRPGRMAGQTKESSSPKEDESSL